MPPKGLTQTSATSLPSSVFYLRTLPLRASEGARTSSRHTFLGSVLFSFSAVRVRWSFLGLVGALGVLVHWESTRSLLKVVRVSSSSFFTIYSKPMNFLSPSLSARPFGSSVPDFLPPLLLFSDASSSFLLSPQTRRHRHLSLSPPLPLHPPSLPLRLPRTLPRTTLPRTTLPQSLSTSSKSSQGTPSSSKATTSRP